MIGISEQKKRMPLKKEKVGIGDEVDAITYQKKRDLFFNGQQSIQNLIPAIFLFKRPIFYIKYCFL